MTRAPRGRQIPTTLLIFDLVFFTFAAIGWATVVKDFGAGRFVVAAIFAAIALTCAVAAVRRRIRSRASHTAGSCRAEG